MNDLTKIALAAAVADAEGRYLHADRLDAMLFKLAAPNSGIGNMSFPQSVVQQKMDVGQLEEIDQQRQKHPRYQGEGNVHENNVAPDDDEDYRKQLHEWYKTPEGKKAVRKFHNDVMQMTGQLNEVSTPKDQEPRPENMEDFSSGNHSIFDINANGSAPFAYKMYDPQQISSTQNLKDRELSNKDGLRGTPDSWKLKVPQTY